LTEKYRGGDLVRKKWIVALAFGLVAGALHFAFLREVEAEARGGKEIEVLVTTAEIEVGETAQEGMVAARSIPAAFVDERVVIAGRSAEIMGLPLAVNLEQGQMIQWTDFVERPSDLANDLAELIGPGQRAMAISVDSSLSMGGLLKPGHRVDILGTFSKGKDLRSDKVTVTLLQNVTVLATGRDLTGSKSEENEKTARYGTVSLSVGLEESELLAFASTLGSLSLVLRGYQDLEVVRDVPEKGMDDVWEAELRNALQERPGNGSKSIERLKVR
jgi:pilus assembly protein CpaB